MRSLTGVVGLIWVLGGVTPATALAIQNAGGTTTTAPKKAKKPKKSSQAKAVDSNPPPTAEAKAATQSHASSVGSGASVQQESSQKPSSRTDGVVVNSEARTSPFGGGEPSVEHGSGIRDTGPHQRSSKLSLFAIVPWYYGFGIGAGARYELPLMPDGFLPTLNDSFELEFGADVWYGSVAFDGAFTGVTVPVEGKWSFHLAPKLAVYGKVGLGWSFYFWSDSFVSASGSGFHYNGATGVVYQLSESFWLRGELGYYGLKLGVSLKF